MEDKMIKKQIDEQRFEFILYINGNIICQRWFSIRGFNEDSLKSMELKWTLNDCVRIVTDNLKEKTEDYLWGSFNSYKVQTEEEIPRIDASKKEDVFGFEIVVDKKAVIKTEFSGNLYPPKVKYGVDIKNLVPALIQEIRNGLSQKNYTKKYGAIQL